jgi:hypothetical protein
MALVVMGKRIAQHRVLNPRKPQKPVKRPTPTTSSTTAEERPPPAIGRDPPTTADFAAGREAARVAALLTWPPTASPHLPHARPLPSVPGMASWLPTGGGPRPSNLSSTTLGPSSRWTTRTMDPRPADGRAAAPVVDEDTHPERKGRHPLTATPQPPSVMLKSWHG